MCYKLIPLHRKDIINHTVPSKPRLRARFGSTMMKCAFTSPTVKWGEWKGNTRTDINTDRQTELIEQIDRSLRIDTTHPIV